MSVDNFNSETVEYVNNWADGTTDILIRNVDKLDLKDTGLLRKSIRSRVLAAASGVLRVQFQFLTDGRFQDLGVGRGRALEDFRSKRQRNKVARRWYARTFYGRLNFLLGAVRGRLEENSLSIISEALNDI